MSTDWDTVPVPVPVIRELPTAASPATEFGDTVFLVKLSRVCPGVHAALRGPELEPIRAEASAGGHCWKLPGGAHVLLYPNQYEGVLKVLREETLRPHHVLITEAFLPLLYHAIAKLPARADVRPSSKRPWTLVDDDGEIVAMVEKTFLNTQARPRRGSGSVVQSERRARDGANPRRVDPAAERTSRNSTDDGSVGLRSRSPSP